MSFKINETLTLVTEECYLCGVMFAFSEQYKKERLADKRGFYCPNGHSQVYVGETEAQKYKRCYEAEMQRAAELRENMVAAQRAQQKAEKSVARLKKRIAAGVCPCCNRTVAQLQKHMATKHKEFMALQGLTERKQLNA